jgi:hypothetical protein
MNRTRLSMPNKSIYLIKELNTKPWICNSCVFRELAPKGCSLRLCSLSHDGGDLNVRSVLLISFLNILSSSLIRDLRDILLVKLRECENRFQYVTYTNKFSIHQIV